MDFDEFRSDINLIAECKPKEGWDFVKILSLLEEVVVKFDAVEATLDKGFGNIDDILTRT